MDPEQVAAVAEVVRQRRKAQAITVAEAARRADLSPRVWHKVEGGEGGVAEQTLRRVALGLGEAAGTLLALAGYDTYAGDQAPADEDRLDQLETRLTALESKVDQLLATAGAPR